MRLHHLYSGVMTFCFLCSFIITSIFLFVFLTATETSAHRKLSTVTPRSLSWVEQSQYRAHCVCIVRAFYPCVHHFPLYQYEISFSFYCTLRIRDIFLQFFATGFTLTFFFPFLSINFVTAPFTPLSRSLLQHKSLWDPAGNLPPLWKMAVYLHFLSCLLIGYGKSSRTFLWNPPHLLPQLWWGIFSVVFGNRDSLSQITVSHVLASSSLTSERFRSKASLYKTHVDSSPICMCMYMFKSVFSVNLPAVATELYNSPQSLPWESFHVMVWPLYPRSSQCGHGQQQAPGSNSNCVKHCFFTIVTPI